MFYRLFYNKPLCDLQRFESNWLRLVLSTRTKKPLTVDQLLNPRGISLALKSSEKHSAEIATPIFTCTTVC